ncbi:hypothetical protein [Rhodococcus jostii]|uniref:hypothetical protein n=1 Tax=Rhodococcus jostii TaxID=132919 RepID=UPI0036419C27
MTTSTMNRLQRLRKLAYAPLVAAVAAGAICTGAGTSTAADTDTPQSGSAYNWYLANHTGQPIYGYWSAEMASGDKSRVETDAKHPWQPGARPAAVQYQSSWHYTTWRGRICYNEHWWSHTSSNYDYLPLGDIEFTLSVDSTGVLFVGWVAMHPENGVCM